MSLYMLLPTVLCLWLNVTANSGIPCTLIAEYRTIANRGVDAGGAVMFVIAFLPTILLAVAAIGGKRILDKLDVQPQKENLEIHSNCTVQFRDDKAHLSFTLAEPNA